MEITIKQSTIKAVAFAMAKNDIRYYLNGMLLQHNGEETRLVCTDGHRLNMAVIEHTDGLLCDLIEVIIPDTLIQTICKAKASRHNKLREITLTIDGNKIAATMPDGTESIAKAVDGRFPDYFRVIPESFSGEVGQYNSDYVHDAFAAVKTYLDYNATPEWKHSGESVGGIVSDGFIALVMPLRSTDMGADTSVFRTAMRLPEKIAELEAIAE